MTDIVISKDDERASLDRTGLRCIGDPPEWIGSWRYRDYQIALTIDGDEQAPYGQLVSLASIVLPKLEAIEKASDAYIRSFINDREGFYKAPWKLQALRIWWNPYSKMAGQKFEARLSVEEDDYGKWCVRFAYHAFPSNVLSPYLFSRRQS